jgi:hypothetical protein
MKFTKSFYHIFYILAFIYLVMCPSVHQLGDIVRHDFTPQVVKQIQQKTFKKESNLNTFQLSNYIQTVDFDQTKILGVAKLAPSLISPLGLSALSTVRLIL